MLLLCSASVARSPKGTVSYLLLIYVFLSVLMRGFLVVSSMRPGGGDGLRLLG